MPRLIFQNGTYTFSGSYFYVDGNFNGVFDPGDEHNAVTGVVNGSNITFNDPGHFGWYYDVSWGNPNVGILVLGNGSGAYHIFFLGKDKFDWKTLNVKYHNNGSSGSGNYFTINYMGATYVLGQDNTGTATTTVFTPCYIAGSMVRTPEGETAIEKLSPGDSIITYLGDREVPQKVLWHGVATVHVVPDLPDDQAGYPVVIRKNSLGSNSPSQDMKVTAEHCLFINEQFIPVRMLVNGKSIYYDKTVEKFSVYHVMTENHAVISVDNVPTETLLYNKRSTYNFHTQAAIEGFVKKEMEWGRDSAAPLTCQRDVVEPVWTRLFERAKALFPESMDHHPPVTTSHGIHLETDDSTIQPVRSYNDYYFFHLNDCKSFWIRSNASRPYDAIGNFVDDRRTLGVLVSEISFFPSSGARQYEVDFLADSLHGWHASMGDSVRWTTGNAEVNLDMPQEFASGLLCIKVAAGGPYITA